MMRILNILNVSPRKLRDQFYKLHVVLKDLVVFVPSFVELVG